MRARVPLFQSTGLLFTALSLPLLGSCSEPAGPNGSSLVEHQPITAGSSYTCGITASGVTYCWGRDVYTETPQTSPTVVGGGLRFRQISAGSAHVCGLTSSGAAYCWGENVWGQLGNGALQDQGAPSAVQGGLTFRQISVGYQHTCAITGSGAAYCWGKNRNGQLGNNEETPKRVPAAVGRGLQFRSISAGQEFTCGVTTAGAAYCWGENDHGQLGTGDSRSYYSPHPVAGDLTIQQIDAGAHHACGLTASGTAYCWGGNQSGALGDGSGAPVRPAPVAVSGGHTFVEITAGGGIVAGSFSCALTPSGAAYCWGQPWMVGQGSMEPAPTPTAVAGGLTFSRISSGTGHSVATTADGTMYAWGGNWHGELGDGTRESRLAPIHVAKGLTFR